MTRSDFAPYLRTLADRMGLAHWTIEVSDELPKDSAYACVNAWFGRHGATIRISDKLVSETPEEQRYSCVHELVHCHLAHVSRLSETEITGKAHEAWTIANEYAVDGLAKVIAASMPLPLKMENLPCPQKPTSPDSSNALTPTTN